jgi:hypothetical protein
MAYVEGYRVQRGFHRALRPRYLKQCGFLSTRFCASFYVGFFHATRRRQITSISVTAGIIVLMLLVRLLTNRGAVLDAGGQSCARSGLLILFGIQALTSTSPILRGA